MTDKTLKSASRLKYERATHAARIKAAMRCGEVRKSYLPNKKVMQKVCTKGGKSKIIHAGAKGYKNNHDPARKANFRARQKCDQAKPGTPKHLACEHLWGKHNKFDTKR
jgi:hypothetical protein